MQSAAALQFLGVGILVGHFQVYAFGTMPKQQYKMPDLSEFDGDTIETKAESADGSDPVKEVIAAEQALGFPFCTEMSTKYTDLGDAYCNTVTTEAECGHGDKVFRHSSKNDDTFDLCAWKDGKCKLAKYSYVCGAACLTYEPEAATTCAHTVYCDKTDENLCYDPDADTSHSCACSKVWTKEQGTHWACTVQAVHTGRRLDETTCIICGTAQKEFCYTPIEGTATICDCNKASVDGAIVEQCGTRTVLVEEDDESPSAPPSAPPSSPPEIVAQDVPTCVSGVEPTFWPTYRRE